MTAIILSGTALGKNLKEGIKAQVQARKSKGLPAPGLSVILIGNDPASQIYIQHKQQACEEVGFLSFPFLLPEQTSQSELLALVNTLNLRAEVHGILIQLPLPKHLDLQTILTSIHPHKDVDGFHPLNMGLLAQGRAKLRPATPKGIMTLIRQTLTNIAGLHAVVVGASNIVGRPMALELLLAGCTVTICNHHTPDISEHTKRADILVTAVGKPHLIPGDWIKPGALVIDVGITRLDNGSLSGDLDFETAKKVAGWITPVPGGVGPLTIASLLDNTLLAANLSSNQEAL